MDNALAITDNIKKDITQETDPKRVKEFESFSKAAIAWAYEQDNYEVFITASRAYIEARRRFTELILPYVQRGGTGSNQHESKGNEFFTLADYGFTKMQWNRRCKELEITEEEIETFFDDYISNGWWPSLAGILKEKEAQKREAARAEIAAAGAKVKASDKWHVYHGDIATWEAPRQYDFIITDPPYPKEYLPLWEVLAQRAGEWLKPNGMLIAMTPHFHLDKIMEMMGRHLQFYWIAAYLVPGQTAGVAQRRINPQWKPLLIYAPVKYTGKTFTDVFASDGNDKDNHKWGQSESGMKSIVSKICLPGQYILDPFCGAGTTGIAALSNDCLFDGLDNDMECVNISKGRLSK